MGTSSVTTNRDGMAMMLGSALTAASLMLVFHLRQQQQQAKKAIRGPGIKAWRMSKWVKHNGIMRTQGLCGDFSKMPSTTAQQTTEALAKLDDILHETGLERKDLVAITIYIADISPNNFEEMNQVYDAWVDPKGLPTRLCVQAKMGHNAAVEIRAEAGY